jgi:hypothetical protein
MTAIKASIISAPFEKMKEGDALQLKREKAVLQASKKQPQKFFKAATPPPIASVVRVLFNENEIGKLDSEYAKVLAPLLDKNYIFVEASLKAPPTSWNTFSPFWINLEVFLAESVISKPLTEIFAIKDNVRVEDEKMLNELQQTKDAFISLFELVRVDKITDTLIKRAPYNSKFQKDLEPPTMRQI